METKTKLIIGFLILLISSSIIYVTFSDKGKIRVDEDKTTFYVLNDNNRWVIAGREYNYLLDGNSKLYRDVSNIEVKTWNDSIKVWVQRTTPYKRGPVIIDTYEFDSSIEDIESFPISHTIEIFNGTGYFYKYEVKNLIYDGPTFKLDGKQTSQAFGRNMKVEWWKDYRLGWVYKSGKMYVKSEKLSAYEKFNARLFDPEQIEFNNTLFSSYLWFTTNMNITRNLKLERYSNITSTQLSIEGFESNLSNTDSFESNYDGWTNYTSGISRETNWSTNGSYSIYFDTESTHQSINKTIDLSNILFIIYDFNLTVVNSPGCGIYFNDIFIRGIGNGIDLKIDVQNYYGEYDIKFKCFYGLSLNGPSKGYLDNIRFFDGPQISYSLIFNDTIFSNFINLSEISLDNELNNSDNNYSTFVKFPQAGGTTYDGWFNETWNTTDIIDPFYRIKLRGSKTEVSVWNNSVWNLLNEDYRNNNISLENNYYTSLYNISNYVVNNQVQLKIRIYSGAVSFGASVLYSEETYYYESDIGSISSANNYFIPFNPWLEIGSPDTDYEWNYSENFTSSENASDFSIEINASLNAGNCDCIGCNIDNLDCIIPFIFHSDTQGLLKYSLLNVTYNTNPISTLNSPNNYINLSGEITFNASSYHDFGALVNITLLGSWGDGWHENQTKSISGSSNETIFNLDISDGSYSWRVSVCDNVLCRNSTSTSTFNIDSTYPLIEFGTGTDNTGTNHTPTNNWIYVNVSVTETNERNITFLLFNSTVQVNLTNFTDNTRTINWTGLDWENYVYNVTVCDYASNCNSTETWNLSILADFNASLSPNMAFDFLPDNSTHQQVEPVNQTNVKGILIMHNNLTANGSILFVLNETYNNISIWVNDIYNYSNATKLNTTNYYEIIPNLIKDTTIFLWMWADYNDALHPLFPALDILLRRIT